MELKIASIGSSSSGNSYLVSNEKTKLLLDVGLSAKKIKAGLSECGVKSEEIQAIFITHEHVDHVKSIRAMAKACNEAKVFATRGTVQECERFQYIPKDRLQFISAQDKVTIGDIDIKAFALSHDAAEPVGFSFSDETRNMTVATDTGIVTDEIYDEIVQADKLILEANHEKHILEMGPYPYSVKRRILSNHGHLSNVATGITLARELSVRKSKYGTKGKQKILLAHLSSQNNTPTQARLTIGNILEDNELRNGQEFYLNVAAKEMLTTL